MRRFRLSTFAFVAFVAVLGGPSLVACVQDSPPPPPPPPPTATASDVSITLPPGNRKFKIAPRAALVCKSASAAVCDEQLTFTLKGNLNANERVVISYSSGTAACFTSQQEEISSTTAPNNRAVFNLEPNCPNKSAWFYSVACKLDDGDADPSNDVDCEGVSPVDPGVIIEN